MCELISTKATGTALGHRDVQPIRQQAHDGCRFDPRYFLQLLFAFSERNKKNVAIEIGAEYVKHLRAAHIVSAQHLDVVAGIDLKSPRLRRIAIERNRNQGDGSADQQHEQQHLDSVERFARQRTTFDRHTFLPAEKRRLGIVIQIEQTAIQRTVVETAARRWSMPALLRARLRRWWMRFFGP